MSALNGRELWVGEFRVAPALDEISRDGVTTKIEPRTMRLLLCLAERPGQVVSVEELLDLVWKDVVVSTDSVYQAVGSLRRILGDDPKQPRYIANVMRRGYRLIADVKAVSTVPEVRIQRRPSSRLPLLLVVAGCLVVAVVTAQKLWWRKSATGAEQSSAIATSA